MIHRSLGITGGESAKYGKMREYPVIKELLLTADRAHAVLTLGEWRPRSHARFPFMYRRAMRTLLMLAKTRRLTAQRGGIGIITVTVTECGRETRQVAMRYPCACLDRLPEELLQLLFAYITAADVPDVWTKGSVESSVKSRCSLM